MKSNLDKALIIFFLFFLMNNFAQANVYSFSFKGIDGEKIDLKNFKGKPIIIVNTASFCGYTNQYQQLQNLFEKYKKNDLVLIGVPSNDFGNQEFKENKEVKEFCETKFNISFKLTEITKIKNKGGHSFFKWVKTQKGFLSFPKWNFYKYLFNREGKLVAWFSSIKEPNSKIFLKEVENIIKK